MIRTLAKAVIRKARRSARGKRQHLYRVGDFGPELFVPASLMSGDAED